MPTAEQLGDRAFWERLQPDLAVTEHPFRTKDGDFRMTTRQEQRALDQIMEEGYFQIPPVIPPADYRPLAQAIARLDEARVLPVFISVYDVFWQFLYGLRNTFVAILGEAYRLPPDFWVWHITPNAGGRGWNVHRDATLTGNPSDCVRPDGRPRLCTVWVPLTDATPHNSCIYVLPFTQDPCVMAYLKHASPEEIERQKKHTNMFNVRALPAAAGSLLGWSPYIAHWGSISTKWADEARVSVGIYYQSADVKSIGRLFDATGRRHIETADSDFRLDFENRMTIIANILTNYIDSGHMSTERNYSPAVRQFWERWKLA